MASCLKIAPRIYIYIYIYEYKVLKITFPQTTVYEYIFHTQKSWLNLISQKIPIICF